MSVIGPFRGQYYCFSTYFNSNFVYTLPTNGLNAVFPNIESVIQAAKFQADAARRMLTLYSSDPRAIHRYGRTQAATTLYHDLLPSMLLEANEAKFLASQPLAHRLMDTNPNYLLNYNYWHDTYLGVCACDRCKHTGLNLLGVALMATRQRLFEIDNQADVRVQWRPPQEAPIVASHTGLAHQITLTDTVRAFRYANQDTPNGWMNEAARNGVYGPYDIIDPNELDPGNIQLGPNDVQIGIPVHEPDNEFLPF